PILVHHYVAAHWYRPPEEFIAAVLAWDPSEAPDPERAALELALALQPTNPAHAWRLWKRLHGRCRAVVRRLFRPAALTSLAGAAAFANAYFELLEISLEKPRLVYVDRELRFALRRAAHKLQGEDRRRIEWVLQCVAPTPKGKKGRRAR